MGKVKLNSGHGTIMRERFKMEDTMAKASLFSKVRPTKGHLKTVCTMVLEHSSWIEKTSTKDNLKMVYIMVLVH